MASRMLRTRKISKPSGGSSWLVPWRGMRQQRKPSRRTSERRWERLDTARSSPVSPYLADGGHAAVHHLSRKLEAAASTTGRSAAGSFKVRPPMTLI